MELLTIWIFIWILVSTIGAAVGATKGRPVLGFFLCFIFGVLGLIVVALLPSKETPA